MAESESKRIESSHSRSAGLAILYGWLLPGGGHFYLGHRNKAVLFCSCLLLLFSAGMVIGYGKAVDPQHHWVLFIAQVCAGPVSVLGWVVGERMDPMVVNIAPRLVDLGVVFTVVAGALNAIVISDAYARATRLKWGMTSEEGRGDSHGAT